MHILHTVDNFYAELGGVAACTYDLVAGLNDIGCGSDTLSLSDGKHCLTGNGEHWMKLLPDDAKTPFRYSRAMKDFLEKETDYGLYHTNGLWLYCNHITAKVARKKKKPYVISPHGMLYSKALSRSSCRKKMITLLMFGKDLRHADCIHATCRQELESVRRAGYSAPVAVIPNPVCMQMDGAFSMTDKGTGRLGFLGRLHPIKKIERLIRAFATLDRKDAELIIMGSGDDEYEAYLRKEALRLNLRNVVFTGFVAGREKYRLLSSLTALFVPGDFESFGMTVPEALMMKVPVMAGLDTPWEELNTRQCGWWVANCEESIAVTMKKALSLSEQERKIMGENGRSLVLEHYTADKIALKMKRLYDWILYGGEKPGFVY
ncbi:MAG: glycosyltransferase [Tannerella sp.]|jgi:glycosyltransferase involved in cell wall biosynthesis|nr:glycosyltransferase [Tannerella sp.]